jgi:hypothetical protein
LSPFVTPVETGFDLDFVPFFRVPVAYGSVMFSFFASLLHCFIASLLFPCIFCPGINAFLSVILQRNYLGRFWQTVLLGTYLFPNTTVNEDCDANL